MRFLQTEKTIAIRLRFFFFKFLDQDSPKRTKLKQLNRQLNTVRRKLEDLEIEFENTPGGYKQTQKRCWTETPELQ